jgi:hypothetical protein
MDYFVEGVRCRPLHPGSSIFRRPHLELPRVQIHAWQRLGQLAVAVGPVSQYRVPNMRCQYAVTLPFAHPCGQKCSTASLHTRWSRRRFTCMEAELVAAAGIRKEGRLGARSPSQRARRELDDSRLRLLASVSVSYTPYAQRINSHGTFEGTPLLRGAFGCCLLPAAGGPLLQVRFSHLRNL